MHSGASTHLTFCDENLSNVSSSNIKVVMGNGTLTNCIKTGDISGLLTVGGKKKAVSATLQDIAYAKEAEYNLLSLTSMMKKDGAEVKCNLNCQDFHGK